MGKFIYFSGIKEVLRLSVARLKKAQCKILMVFNVAQKWETIE